MSAVSFALWLCLAAKPPASRVLPEASVAAPSEAIVSPRKANVATLPNELILLGPHSQEDADALRAGWERLSPALRQLPGGPLRFIFHREARVAGMGALTAEGFHLYAIPPKEERWAGLRLTGLDAAARRKLWRERAVIHAVMARWDDVLALSRRPVWRRLSGWVAPFERPLTWRETALNTFEGAYSRRAGQQSARDDLLTFAEELLVPAPVSDEDEQVACRERSKARVLTQLLADAGLGPAWTQPRCPAFDGWAAVDSLSHLEILLVAASGRRPESLFGHLALQLVRKEGSVVSGPSFGSVVQLVALTGDLEGGWEYVLRGLTGGFSASVVTTAMAGVAHQSLEREQRTIRRYRLNLTDSEQRHLLDRIWELERRGYFDYFFFTDNCASLLLTLLSGALDEARSVVPPPRFSPMMPGAALDAVAKVETANGTPFLTYVPDPYDCTRDAAERAVQRRQELARALRLETLNETTQSPIRTVRARAQRQLLALVSQRAARADAAERDALYDYVMQTVRMERFALDALEQHALEEAKHQRMQRALALNGDHLERRQQAFAKEERVRRSRLVLDSAEELEQSLEEELVAAGEQPLLGELLEERAVFATLSDGQAALVDAHFAEVDAQAWQSAQAQARIEEEKRLTQHALVKSGFARTALGVGGRLEAGAPLPVLSLRTAGFAEELGERRLHGFSASSELRLLEGYLQLQPRAGWPKILASDLTVAQFRTLQRELPLLSKTFLDAFGWGLDSGWRYDAFTPLSYDARVAAEVVGVASASRDWSRFTALGVGPQLNWVQIPVLSTRV
ncbi:MAG: lipoprotein N-acyltransferase Lnb domain-containing protein [Myxococcaceae bacterium]